jgi:hypothetical protein
MLSVSLLLKTTSRVLLLFVATNRTQSRNLSYLFLLVTTLYLVENDLHIVDDANAIKW